MSFKLTKKQCEANELLASPATHIMLAGGSRSAKTTLLCRAIAIRAFKAPASRHAIFRYRFNHVKNSVVLDTWPKMMRMCFPQVQYHIDKSDWYCRLPNDSEIWFGGLDDKERSEKMLGLEFATMFLNECSQISLHARNLAITRLAQQPLQIIDHKTTVPLAPKMYYDENPPPKSHWTYKMFVKKIDPETKRPLNDPDDFAFLLMNPEDNKENLSAKYLETLRNSSARNRSRFYLGEFRDVTDNALFSDDVFEKWRVLDGKTPQMVRVVIAVDPSGAGDEDILEHDAIGIVAAGLGIDGNAYILEDNTVRVGPATWGKVATDTYDRLQADMVVGEINYGGAMVKHVIQTARRRTPYQEVRATRGKIVRADPIAALYEQGRVRHVGYFQELEDELLDMTTAGYIGEKSPNRADAAIWAVTALFEGIVSGQTKHKHTPQPPCDWRVV